MTFDALLAVLLTAAICGLVAFLAALLLRTRTSVLGYVGAGLLGKGIGEWLGAALKAMDWPFSISLGGAVVHVLWTFVGALIVLLVAKLVAGRGRWR
jgi:hypothetical protein